MVLLMLEVVTNKMLKISAHEPFPSEKQGCEKGRMR